MEICEAGTDISVANSAWLMYTVLAPALSRQRGSDSLNGHTGGTADSDHGAAYPNNRAPGSDRRRRRRAPSDGQGDSHPSPPDRRRAQRRGAAPPPGGETKARSSRGQSCAGERTASRWKFTPLKPRTPRVHINTEHQSAGATRSSAPKHATQITVTETFLAEQSHVAQTAKLRNVVMTVPQRPMGRGQAGV